MKFWFIMGTAAELIKVYPVIREVQDRGWQWFVWSTGQGADNFMLQYDDFKLPRENVFCLDEKAKDLESSAQAVRWMSRNLLRSASSLRNRIKELVGSAPETTDLCLVHGDTFSTVLGARYALRLGCRLAHIEAGLRSSDVLNPFPEEINRRMVSRWAHLHYAPDSKAAGHLRDERQTGEIVITGGNSVYDAMIKTLDLPRAEDLPKGDYVVANLHRFENLQSGERWKKMIDTLLKAQKVHPTYFVMHPPTEHKLENDPDAKETLIRAGVVLLPRQSYTRFVHLLARASFVLTDGGSNQTECAYLGLPCLILREKTELPEGLGQNCILTAFDQVKIDSFLREPQSYRRPAMLLPQSPSRIIAKSLQGVSR